MGRPSRQVTLMAVAEVMAHRGTCSRAAVGVVIARDGRILSTGYNGAPAGMEHCDHTLPDAYEPTKNWREDYELVTEHESIYIKTSGDYHVDLQTAQNYGWIKPIYGPCTVAIHAEANALAYAARWGVPLQGAELYTTFCPCLPCAQLIVAAGITCVYYRNEYRDRSGLELLKNAGIDMMML